VDWGQLYFTRKLVLEKLRQVRVPASDVEDPPFRGGDDVVAGVCAAYVTSSEPSPHLWIEYI
jgi:hypothetical protein